MTTSALFDPAGAQTLEIMSHAGRYNRWQYERIAPFCGQRICEIGSGIGNMSKLLVSDSVERVVLTDRDESYLSRLRRDFEGDPRVSVAELSIPDMGQIRQLKHFKFDTVVALNVVEHIEDDVGALSCLAKLPEHGGRIIILVPAMPRLHNKLDSELGHWRRYSPSVLRARFTRAGISLERIFYFNLLGAVGWWVNGSIVGASRISSFQLSLFDRLVPLLKLEDRIELPFGQSLIAIGSV